MTNGCICSALREDLLKQLQEIANVNRFNYLLFERTGISEPLLVASTFNFRDENGNSLSDISIHDTMVTVVDAVNLIKYYNSKDFIKDRGEQFDENDNRTPVDFLVEQIEFANVILINKIDLICNQELRTVEEITRGLNARAKIIKTKHSQVYLKEVLGSQLFNFEEAKDHPLWAHEHDDLKNHSPETEEYGIRSFVYVARKPFDPIKIYNFFNEDWAEIFRPKGFFWIASRPHYVREVFQAGALARHQGIGRWWATVLKERWPQEISFKNTIDKYYNEEYVNRRQEIVISGLTDQISEKYIRSKLDACLVQDYLNVSCYDNTSKDPFPNWFTESVNQD